VGNPIWVLLGIYCFLQLWKNFANRSRIDKVIAMVSVAPFLTHGVVYFSTWNSLRQTSLQCLTTMNMVFSDEDKILIKNVVFEGVYSKEVDRRISWEKLGKSVVLISCSKSSETQAQLTGGQAAADRPQQARTHILSKKIAMPSYTKIFQIFLLTHKYSQHSYTRTGIKIGALKMQFVCIFFYICWIFAENLNF